jgi:hypothetical protein
MFSKRTVLWLALSLALVFSISCSKKDEDDTSSESTDSTATSTAKGPAYKPTGDEGTVSACAKEDSDGLGPGLRAEESECHD